MKPVVQFILYSDSSLHHLHFMTPGEPLTGGAQGGTDAHTGIKMRGVKCVRTVLQVRGRRESTEEGTVADRCAGTAQETTLERAAACRVFKVPDATFKPVSLHNTSPPHHQGTAPNSKSR
ncbi:hypothetical protein E2C01_009578 [Portunus trituberculatus]|uniref:Uncharacterized protein n=1 Tax=Portunus trituberculatus TaxID=210409 RepID=A0A5B7D659_PORTR|nr:hypothetical protein [Portunus trituberculatus]